jgi:hypothetical protein
VVWSGRCGDHGVDLIGTVPAALATYLALAAWPHADLVLSAGTAGGFKARVSKGQGCLIKAFGVFVHAQIRPPRTTLDYSS